MQRVAPGSHSRAEEIRLTADDQRTCELVHVRELLVDRAAIPVHAHEASAARGVDVAGHYGC